MTSEQRIKNLSVPSGKIDVILDTDAYNEIDDQYAIAYMLRSEEKLNVKAIYAAPFLNHKVSAPKEGMEKSYDEILKILRLAEKEVPVFKGSEVFLKDEQTPVISDAALDLAERVKDYSSIHPLYVVAIGAITNIASAILLNPLVAENIVLVWLGGNAHHYHHTAEFNMMQDIAAARVIIQSGVPFVQLPCIGVVSAFTLSKPEIECWLKGKGKLADYLADITLEMMKKHSKDDFWKKVIWDVTAVAWLLNDDDKLMLSKVITAPLPSYDHLYSKNPKGHLMRYVYFLKYECLLKDMLIKLTRE